MYVAMLHCNVSQAHWRQGAQWMYSYLLDGDWASNALSWQWVAGSNANKKYIANQENINKYFNSDQKGTYLDIPYKSFANLKIPEVLKDHKPWSLKTALPKTSNPELEQKTTLIYNYYNLDPNWHKGEDYQRLLLLEPSFFEAYPVQEHCIQFIMDLSNNIPGILLCVGEFENILRNIETEHIVFKEHPTNSHYRGKEESRDWMFSVMGYYPSFFSFWKKCKKELKNKIT
jgi:deoxyribodipyrimidine photo-lyase